jgi:hypothetical protein
MELFVGRRISLEEKVAWKRNFATESHSMGRYVLLWLLGVPIPILVLIWAFGGLH